jgi:ADP-ribosyltransferase exoenzyme
MIEAGSLGVRITPIATGFWKEAKGKIDAQDSPRAELKVTADIKRAAAEISGFRMREQANAINLRVKIDERSVKTAEEKVKYIEHTWKQSDIKRAIRVQVYTSGAALLPALSQGIVSVTAAMTELSRVSLALPGLLAGVGAAAGTLLTGLNGIGQALKSSNDGMQRSSQYARQYAQASRELQNAQRDVVKALRDANRELEDQKDKLATGQLSVERAQLNLRRANERMFQGGFKSITDYQEALLDVKQAHIDMAQAVKQNGRDIQDYYANAARGATGSNTYRDSLDKLSNSLDNFHKAQFQAAGMSEQFISAMNRLSPAGQDFVLQLLKMRGAWLGLQSSIQTTLFSGLGDAITNLAQKQLPMLKTGMQQVASSINSDFKTLFAAIGRDANTANLANIFKNTATGIKAAAPGLDSFTSGLLKLSEVGTRFLPRMALAFDHVMARFESFINRADQDGSLNKWIDSGLKLVASLGRSLLDIGSILGSVTDAYNKATGNVGGFASTMERGLGRLSTWLKSPSGQTAMISWMKQSREFMHTIAESLPGIRKIFGELGDGARQFAEYFFPKFAAFGELLGGNGKIARDLVTALLAFRTFKPVGTEIAKVFVGLKHGLEEYRLKQEQVLALQEKLKKEKGLALRESIEADGLRFAAKERLDYQRAQLRIADGEWEKARERRAQAKAELDAARKESREAARLKNSAANAAESPILVPGVKKDQQVQLAADRAKSYEASKAREEKALKHFDALDKEYTQIYQGRSILKIKSQDQIAQSTKHLREATDLAAKAQKNLNEIEETAIPKFSRLRGVIGSGKGSGLMGVLGGLAGALGTVATTIGTVGGTIGVIYAIDQLTAAQDRNKSSADNLKASQEALFNTLSEGTGSATAATLEENVRQLQDRANPVHPDDKGQNFNAAKILEQQLGIKLPEAANLALPTQAKQREARLAPADAQVIAAVSGLDEWKKWGKDYQNNGVTTAIYGKALNGDPDSIGKVEAARMAIKNANTPGLNLGAAVKAYQAPNDLGHAQEQLSRSGPGGGLRGLSLAVGAERSIGNEALAAGQKAFEASNVIQQNGLNARGMRAFGPFTLGAHGAVIRPDGSAVIEVDKYPDDVVKGWIQGSADRGISVERRYPGGAIIKIDAEHGRQYFNGYAGGGPVWGAGTATSDSIPAMLSNGEFVINAKSASLIGHDKLHQMNSMKFAKGGLVRGFGTGGSPDDGNSGSILGNAWDWFKNLFSPDPVGMVPGDSRRPDAAEHDWGPVPANPIPVVTDPVVDSSPVTLPYNPPVPPPANPGKGIGANLGGGNLYVPTWGGSGALPDFGTTGASAAKNAPIIPDANILDYLQQTANAYGLFAGAGPGAGGLPLKGQDPVAFGRANEIASQFGIQTHPNDGMEHSVDRALDIGTSQQSQNGSITKFVEDWMADPQKVAATRQLIYKDPKTGKVYGIINGHPTDANVTYGDIDRATGRRTIDEHDDHVHLALEGVPLNALSQSGAGAPTGPGATGMVPPPTSLPVTPPTPTITSGPAADVSTPNAPQTPGVIKGPFGDIPFDPIYILKQIGAAILKGVFAFFGVDGSGFVDALFALGDRKPPGPSVADIPQPDQKVIDSLDQQIAQYDKMGPAGKQMADQLRAGKADYLKPFEAANSTQSANSAADYFDSIGDHTTADKLRKANNPNPEKFSPVTTVPGTGNGPTVLPRPSSGGLSAPGANYSGGTPEVHNAVYRAFKEAGYPDSEWPSLVTLLNHENNTWDPTRPTGGPNSDARGIFQFLSSTWGAVGMQPSDDPYQQAVAGMKYIKQNYATPTGAWTFWQHPSRPPFDQNWYSRGGAVKKFSAGGKVRGPGTGTSDSIPAMLSAGEFVMRADAVNHWGEDKLHAMNCYSGGGSVGAPPPIDPVWIAAFLGQGALQTSLAAAYMRNERNDPKNKKANGGLIRRYAPGGLVTNDNNNGQLSNWWENISNFGKGFVGGAKEMVTGIAPLVGLGPDGGPGVADSWKAMGKGLAPLVGLGGANAPGVGDAWKQFGKGAIRYDEWTGGEKAKAAGGNLFDLVTTILPGGALTKGVKSGELGAKAAQVAKNAGGAFSSPRVFADSLKLTPERKASLADIPHVDLKGINPLSKRQALTAIADLHATFPEVPISSLSSKGFSEISKLWGKKYAAMAVAYADPADRAIVLNKAMNNIPGNLFGSMFGGFNNSSFGKSNIYALIAHEFGHLVDFHDGKVSMNDVAIRFIEHYAKDKPELLTADGQLSFGGMRKTYESKDFANMVLGALSSYSYKNPQVPRSIKNLFPIRDPKSPFVGIGGAALDRINLVEAKAEAFSDVAMNGDKARPGSKIINDLVLSSIRARKEYQQKLVDMGVELPSRQPPPIPGTRLTGSKPPAMSKKGASHGDDEFLSGDFIWEGDEDSVFADHSLDAEMAASLAQDAIDEMGPTDLLESYIALGAIPPPPLGIDPNGLAGKAWSKVFEEHIGYLSESTGGPKIESVTPPKKVGGAKTKPVAMGPRGSGPGGVGGMDNIVWKGTNDKESWNRILSIFPKELQEGLLHADRSNFYTIGNSLSKYGDRIHEFDDFIKPEFKSAINDYTQGSSLNSVLRDAAEGRPLIDPNKMSAFNPYKAQYALNAQKNMDELLGAMDQAGPIQHNAVITRMVPNHAFGNPAEMQGDDIARLDFSNILGKEFQDPGFLSTALGGKGLLPSDGLGGVNGKFGIVSIVPKDSKGIFLAGHGKQSLSAWDDSERELLLPPGGSFTPFRVEYASPENPNYGALIFSLYKEGKNPGKINFPEPDWKAAAKGRNQQQWISEKMGLISSKTGFSENEIARKLGWMNFPGLKKAEGGFISGPGGPKSDSIPAMLSNGEFVMNAAATRHWGADTLHAMNCYADGGPVSPTGSADPDAFKDLRAIMTKPLITPAATGSSDPDAFKNLDTAGNTVGNAIGSALAPKGGASGMSASAPAPRPKDPRAILGRAPTSDEHTNPALSSGIRGAFNTIGAIASQAAAIGASAATAVGTGGAPVPGAGQAASALVGEGFQIAGDVAAGAANVVSALLVGTVTPSETGQGYGAPLLPQQQPGGGINNFQSIHNGNVVTNNLSEYSRLKDRKDAQKAAPFLNRVNH